ncbi:hypothetical protein GCM10027168_60410 [Streptomyces capparidis]
MWRTRTTLWGATAWPSRSTAYTPLRFPGQYFDQESGLCYNFRRYYDPETAQYISRDPLGLATAPNPSSYVHNPHTRTDPLGLAPDYADLGDDWQPRPTGTIPGSSGCEAVARDIQARIGGERMRITDSAGAPLLGKYRDQDTFWGHHDVVVKDGRVYDAWTGRYGEPVEEYRRRWEWGEYLRFDPAP